MTSPPLARLAVLEQNAFGEEMHGDIMTRLSALDEVWFGKTQGGAELQRIAHLESEAENQSLRKENQRLRKKLRERPVTRRHTVVLIVANDYAGMGSMLLAAVQKEAQKYQMIADASGHEAVVLTNASIQLLRAKLREHRPTVLVFCGHGDFRDMHARKKAGSFSYAPDNMRLAFMDESGGKKCMQVVPDNDVKEALLSHATETARTTAVSGSTAAACLRLVLFNACVTSRLAKLLDSEPRLPGLEHVIGWETATADAAASIFGSTFIEHYLRDVRDARTSDPDAADLVWKLARIEAQSTALFAGVYEGLLTKQVRQGENYAAFCKMLESVDVPDSEFAQNEGDLVKLYGDAKLAERRFEQVLWETKNRVRERGIEARMRLAPMKHIFRVLQKNMMRIDGKSELDCSMVRDVVRGSITCDRMTELLEVLNELLKLQDEHKIRVVRIKNRFAQPTAHGWADAVLNILCLDPAGASHRTAAATDGERADKHVCELQLVHSKMLAARKTYGGHAAYSAFREAAELLDFVQAHAKDYLGNVGEDEDNIVSLMRETSSRGIACVHNSNGENLLMLACKRGHAQLVATLLKEEPSLNELVNDRSGSGFTALMLASQNGHEGAISEMLVGLFLR
eukprot:g3009.t1